MEEVSTRFIQYQDFTMASKSILQFLSQHLGFGLWMVTRKEGADWIALQVENHEYDLEEPIVFHWADSICSRMVKGVGPRIIPDIRKVSSCEVAPIRKQLQVGSYIGLPLNRRDGSLFGTLCAMDPTPQDESINDALPMLELMVELLGSILNLELLSIEQKRLLEKSQREAMTDDLTGVLNRRGWEEAIRLEELRSRRYGSPGSIFVVDLDGLKQINDTKGHAYGDCLLQKAAVCLKNALRENDILARLGGDEFGILAIDCDRENSERLLGRLLAELAEHDVRASIGKAVRDPRKGFADAIEVADAEMYKMKAKGKSAQ